MGKLLEGPSPRLPLDYLDAEWVLPPGNYRLRGGGCYTEVGSIEMARQVSGVDWLTDGQVARLLLPPGPRLTVRGYDAILRDYPMLERRGLLVRGWMSNLESRGRHFSLMGPPPGKTWDDVLSAFRMLSVFFAMGGVRGERKKCDALLGKTLRS